MSDQNHIFQIFYEFFTIWVRFLSFNALQSKFQKWIPQKRLEIKNGFYWILKKTLSFTSVRKFRSKSRFSNILRIFYCSSALYERQFVADQVSKLHPWKTARDRKAPFTHFWRATFYSQTPKISDQNHNFEIFYELFTIRVHFISLNALQTKFQKCTPEKLAEIEKCLLLNFEERSFRY